MKPTNQTIDDYLESIDPKRKDDILALIKLFEDKSGYPPVLWGSIVGFGHLHYKYASGHEGHMPLIGFANRKQAIVLYILNDTSHYPLLTKLGKHKASKACIYVNRLSDIDISILSELIDIGMRDTLNQDFITNIS